MDPQPPGRWTTVDRLACARAAAGESVSRAAAYLRRMFPPSVGLMGLVTFLSGWLALQALAGLRPLHLGFRAGAGAATTVLWLLLVRLLDDLHDAPHDLRLAAAGDPRYLRRPIATGAISPGELRALAALTATALVAVNLRWFGVEIAAVALGGATLTWLASNWCFVPAVARKAGPLAHLARKALALLAGAYLALAFRATWPAAALPLPALLFLVAPTLELAAWETARKIRLPEDETAYATYSRRFGWRRAALLPAIFALLAAATLLPAGLALGLGWPWSALLVGATAGLVLPAVRLRLAPSREHARLQPFAEAAGGLLHAGLIGLLILHFGITP